MYLVYMAELAIPAAALAGLYFLKQKPEPEHINTYKNNQSYTERYHTKDKNQFMKHKNTKNTKKKFTSLTGDNVEHGNLKHNNISFIYIYILRLSVVIITFLTRETTIWIKM